MRAALLDDAASFGGVEQVRRLVDTDAPADVELGFGERVSAFVLSDDLFTRSTKQILYGSS